MKKEQPNEKYYLLLIIALLSIASLLCGATLIGISMNTPTGTTEYFSRLFHKN